MLLAVSGMYQLEKKEGRPHPKLKEGQGSPSRNRLKPTNLIFLIKDVAGQHALALVNPK
jgi:hypothetical protein